MCGGLVLPVYSVALLCGRLPRFLGQLESKAFEFRADAEWAFGRCMDFGVEVGDVLVVLLTGRTSGMDELFFVDASQVGGEEQLSFRCKEFDA